MDLACQILRHAHLHSNSHLTGTTHSLTPKPCHLHHHTDPCHNHNQSMLFSAPTLSPLPCDHTSARIVPTCIPAAALAWPLPTTQFHCYCWHQHYYHHCANLMLPPRCHHHYCLIIIIVCGDCYNHHHHSCCHHSQPIYSKNKLELNLLFPPMNSSC